MQSLNQGCQPIRMRARWSWLNASRLRLGNMRKCSLGLLRDSGSNWLLFERSGMMWRFTLWSLRGTMLCPFSKGMTLYHLKRDQWYWLLTKQDSSFFWWMNTFKNHDLHDKTAERKTHPCIWSSYCFPHGLKYVSKNVNWSSFDQITQKLCSSMVENMISVRVFNSGPNFAVPMEVPAEETSWLTLRMSRISITGASLSSYGVMSTFSRRLMWRIFTR